MTKSRKSKQSKKRRKTLSPMGDYFSRHLSLILPANNEGKDALERIFEKFTPPPADNPLLKSYEQFVTLDDQAELTSRITAIFNEVHASLFDQENLEKAFDEVRQISLFESLDLNPNAKNIITRAYLLACISALPNLPSDEAQIESLTESVSSVDFMPGYEPSDSKNPEPIVGLIFNHGPKRAATEQSDKFKDRILKIVDTIQAKRQQLVKLKQFLNCHIETLEKIDNQGDLGRIFNDLDKPERKLDFNPVDERGYEEAVQNNILVAWVGNIEQQVEQFLFVEENLKNAFGNQQALFNKLMAIPDAKYAFISSYVLTCIYLLSDYIAKKYPRNGEVVEDDCEIVGLEDHDERADLGRQEENVYISRIHKIINEIHQKRKEQEAEEEKQVAIAAPQARPASPTVIESHSTSEEDKNSESDSPDSTQMDDTSATPYGTPLPTTSVVSPTPRSHKPGSIAGSEFSTDGADTIYGTPTVTTPYGTPETYPSAVGEEPDSEFVSIADTGPNGQLRGITIMPRSKPDEKEENKYEEYDAHTHLPRSEQPQSTVHASAIAAAANVKAESKNIVSQPSAAENYLSAITAAIETYNSLNPSTPFLCCFESQGTRRVNKLEAKLNKVKTADENSKLRKFTELTQFVDRITSGEDYWCIHKRRENGLDNILINSLKMYNLPVLIKEKYSKQVEDTLGQRILNHR